jgi:CubicO group peptidase (beta-lactamase class C family)
MWINKINMLLLAACWNLFPQWAFSQTSIKDFEQDQTFQMYADSVVGALSTKYKIPGGAVVLTDNGKVIFQSSFGYAQVEEKVLITPQSQFRLGSVTKMFTAISIMQLVEQGKIDLDASVETYLPDLKPKQVNSANPIKIRHLLTHTSGFTHEVFNHAYGTTIPPQQTLVKWASEEVLTIEPGYMFNYSNIGYGLLGVVIERVSGLSYAEYIQKHIFTPLGMRATAAMYEVPDDKTKVQGYNEEGKNIPEPLTRDIAAGGVLSTLEDLTALTLALANPDLLEQASVLRRSSFEAMTTPQTQNLVLATDSKFGLGVFIVPLGIKDDNLIGDGVGHVGDFTNYHALSMGFPKAQLGISIVCNGALGDAFYQALYHRLLRKYYAITRSEEGSKSNANTTFSVRGAHNESIHHREISGIYGGGGSGFVQLSRINNRKIRFKQGKNILVLKRDDATNRYSVRYKLLRLIPIKVKDMEFGFIKVDGRIVLKSCYPQSGKFEYISRKDISKGISSAWRNRVGDYEVVNPFEGNISMVPLKLVVVQNKLVMHRRYLLTGEEDEVGFDILDDQTAISDGIDRGCAGTLKVLPNGNLYYSGYEIRVMKPK